MSNNDRRPDRRTVLRTGVGVLSALGAGCFGVEPPGTGQNETPTNETDAVDPEENDELELVFEDWFEENTVDAGVWETEFPWGERVHNFNAYALPDNAYVYDDKLVLKALEQPWEVPPGEGGGNETGGGEGNETDGGPENASDAETESETDNATVEGVENETENRTVENGGNETEQRERTDEENDPPEDEQRDVVPYTTGVATPYRSFSPSYIEGRIRVPPITEGFWPAFWLTPDDQWPPEIDVFEFFGADPCPYMTYYYRDDEGHIQYDEGTHCGPDFSADFHEYAVDWREDRIVWYIDGEEHFRFDDEEYISTEEMRLILNFGIDAPFLEAPNSSDLPAYMEIDWIRVWER